MANPLNNFNFDNGVDVLKKKLQAPFDRFKNAEQAKTDLRFAHSRNDFREGFIITPYNKDGKELTNDVIAFLADAMPQQPFSFGGKQTLVKDYYPGNSEPTVQVLGPQESDVTIKGRLKAKHLKPNDADDREIYRLYPQYIQEAIESVRINGFVVRLNMGSWQRWGFIENATFEMKTLADIDYSINFLIVGFNQPKDFILVDKVQQIPYNTSKELARQLANTLAAQEQVPDDMPKSFADQINSAISDVAAAVNLVTGFVDTVLAEVDSLKASVERAKGLIKNARNKIVEYRRKVGAFSPEADAPKTTSISGGYANAAYIAATTSNVNGLNSFLAQLSSQLRKLTVTTPLARHKIQSGDTLHKLAVKYYNDATKWDKIYDHNKLTSTELTIGNVIEIPRA
jgi:LysM repeat protein